MKHWHRIALCTLWLFCYTLNAAPIQKSKTSINTLKNTIAQQQKQHDKLQSSFKKTDEKINKISRNLKQTNKQISKHKASLNTLKKQKKELTTQLQALQEQLKIHLMWHYQEDHTPNLQWWLNPQQTTTKQRIIGYLDILNTQYTQTITALKQTLENLKNTEKQMQNYQTALKHTQTKQNQQKTALKKQHQQRNTMIKTLEKSIKNKTVALAGIQKDSKELDSIVKKIEIKKTPQEPQPKKSKSSFKEHSLPWPLKGKLNQHFGKKIQDSELKTHGIVINCKQGDPVYAVANGKVAFAKWMSSFGLLIIIDHQNGFMTLYGRNDSIDVEAGDTVEAGDQIASAGQSGTFNHCGLYFSIRQGNKAINPENILINA